jgi:hypothetical protein
MTQINVVLDGYASLVVEKNDGKIIPGLMKTIYVGDGDTPAAEEVVTLESLLNEFIDSNSIPTNPPSLKPEYFQSISEGLDAMAKAIEDARTRLNSLPYWEDKNV